MLYLNEERVNLQKPVGKFNVIEEAAYKVLQGLFKTLTGDSEDIKKVKFPINFEFHSKFKGKNDFSGVTEWPTPRRYRCVKSKSVEGILNGDWILSVGSIKKDHDKNLQPNPSHYVMKKNDYIESNQLDVLFWLYWVQGERFNDEYVIRNEKMEARSEMQLDTLEMNAMQYIFDGKHLKEKELRQLAASYNIKDAIKVDISIVRKNLKKAVKHAEAKSGGKGKGYMEFIERTKMDDSVHILGAIQMAEDEMVIGFDEEKNKWKWSDESGNLGSEICIVTNEKDRYPELKDYFSVNEEIMLAMVEKTEDRMKTLQE